ncbi:hypothetical protein Patl1_29331 [Pistacia atlantica]|uniref:Uncharacterized protein n=1 Tax=Pistacia atlantica TaxID=434234 RepID=A0ACC1BCP7_9ROSI|nr:hypothetical protein Patl1_29331 [Pistacia atlantica]
MKNLHKTCQFLLIMKDRIPSIHMLKLLALVPVAVEASNPYSPDPVTGINTATDANNFETESTSHQELPASVTLGATGVPGIKTQDQATDVPDTKAQDQANEVPDTKPQDQANEVPGAKTQDQANEVPDIKTLAQANEVPDAKTEFETNEVPVTITLAETNEIPVTITLAESNEIQKPLQILILNLLPKHHKLNLNPATPKPDVASADIKPDNANSTELKDEVKKIELSTPTINENSDSRHSFLLDENYEGSESGTEEEQSAFIKELENFFRERSMEFKPPKFYGEGLNCLKLWRAVTRLGGYDKVTSCKLWRQVGESFKPPKTCTTVSWTFRGFYEKALLDYERHKTCGGELSFTVASQSEPMNIDSQASGSGRARRDAAARAMQGWHSQRVLGNGEVSDPIIKVWIKPLCPCKSVKSSLVYLKRKKPSYIEQPVKAARTKASKPQLDIAIVDIGQPADWVKINVQKTKDCFEVYALVPGLLREEVRVQSDPAGRLVISGEPEHPNNPWGVTPFKKVVSLPGRIDPHQTSAVVTLHGQLFVRVPFEPSD